MFNEIEFRRPVDIKQAPGDSLHYFVVEQRGRVLRLDGIDAKSATIYVDIADQVEDGPNEAGLLGLAFHPKYSENRIVFLSYTRRNDGLESVVARFKVVEQTVDKSSKKIVLAQDQPYKNHNGGGIAFGPDGYLYIGFGDGGYRGDPKNNGQNVNTLLGAILRIDVDSDEGYTIPKSNPFSAKNIERNRKEINAREEIFAYGLRNPWRFSFDKHTGMLWVGDVGQNRVEEINIIKSGGNYGWNIKEGSLHYRVKGRTLEGLIDPVVEYGRHHGCSITGGYVYRGSAIVQLKGLYIFGDYCSGTVFAVPANAPQSQVLNLVSSDARIASFGQAHDGTIFVVDHGGRIYRIVSKNY